MVCKIYNPPSNRIEYEHNLMVLKKYFHSRCFFTTNEIINSLMTVHFDDTGILWGQFTGTHHHQGYDAMIHGGIIEALIDASMAQCLMGHGITGYTADLSIRYHTPITINHPAFFETRIIHHHHNRLYYLELHINHHGCTAVTGKGKFIQILKPLLK